MKKRKFIRGLLFASYITTLFIFMFLILTLFPIFDTESSKFNIKFIVIMTRIISPIMILNVIGTIYMTFIYFNDKMYMTALEHKNAIIQNENWGRFQRVIAQDLEQKIIKTYVDKRKLAFEWFKKGLPVKYHKEMSEDEMSDMFMEIYDPDTDAPDTSDKYVPPCD